MSKIKSDLFFATLIASLISMIVITIFFIGDWFWESYVFILIGIAVETLVLLIFILIRQRQLKKQKMFFIESIDEKLTLKKSDEIGFNETCKICKINLEPNQDIVNCPKCNSLFHIEHLQNWLKVKFHCPICQYDFKELYQEEELELD